MLALVALMAVAGEQSTTYNAAPKAVKQVVKTPQRAKMLSPRESVSRKKAPSADQFQGLTMYVNLTNSNEWAEYGINVNGVAPTVVHTYMGERAWQGKVKDDMIEKIPAHRFAEVDEIAAAALFLSCPESNMITGEDLVVDGGFTIY